MKQIYVLRHGIALTILTVSLSISVAFAQPCSCGGGVKPDSITHTLAMTGLTSYTSFSMPQFDPAMGTLTCLRMTDSISAILNFDLINRVDTRFDYYMNALLTGSVSGPSNLIASASYNGTFGPYDLGAAGIDMDTAISVGPTAVFNNKKVTKTINSGLAPYLGIGTVPFTFDLSGPVWPAPSSGNYLAIVQTISDINVNLTYYYCASNILASNIKNFIVTKNNNTININWLATNAESIDNFVIEYSNDGRTFTNTANIVGTHTPSNAYTFLYDVAGNKNNHIYFRIKQTDNKGKSMYSQVRTIALNEKAAVQISTYPNPVVNNVTISFDRLISGNYNVDVINAAGLLVYNKQVKMINSNTIPLEFNTKPSPGIYFTRITHLSTQQQQIIKIVVQ